LFVRCSSRELNLQELGVESPSYSRLPEPFIAQGRIVTMRYNARQVAPGQVKPRSVVWHRGVKSLGTVVVPDEWFIVPMMHCSRLSTRITGIDYAVCLHVLQAHDDPDVRRLKNVRACVRNMRA
jgi:hypothetical protein